MAQVRIAIVEKSTARGTNFALVATLKHILSWQWLQRKSTFFHNRSTIAHRPLHTERPHAVDGVAANCKYTSDRPIRKLHISTAV